MQLNTKTTFTTLSILSFLVSGYFTLLLFKSTAVGLFEAIPMIAIAIIYEFSKWCFLREVVLKRHKNTIKIIIFSLWIFTTIASVIASAGYVLNQSNTSKNLSIESSTAYQNELKGREIKNDLYSTKKKEIDDLITTKGQTITAMEKTRDSWPKDYITMKENAQATINNKISEFDSQIKSKSEELSQISNELSSPIKITGQALSTSGYTAIFKTLSDFLNKNDNNSKQNPYKAENIELWFYLLLGVGVEALANMFAYLSQKTNITYTQNCDFKPKPENNRTLETTTFNKLQKKFKLKPEVIYATKNNNRIGFKPEPKLDIVESEPKPNIKTSIDETELNRYIKYMYEKQRNGFAPGYMDTARNLQMPIEKARAIKGELIRRGIIKTKGNRTLILA